MKGHVALSSSRSVCTTEGWLGYERAEKRRCRSGFCHIRTVDEHLRFRAGDLVAQKSGQGPEHAKQMT